MSEENSSVQNAHRKRLKILFLTPRFPYPVIGGDRIKPTFLLKHLVKRHDVTLVTFYHGGEAPKEYIEEVEKLGVELFVVPLNPVKASLRAGFVTTFKYPLEIGFYTQPEYHRLVDKLTAERNYDLAFAFFMRTAEYIKDKTFKKILISEDCRTLYQGRSYKASKNLLQRLVRWWEYHRLRIYEPALVDKFDTVTLVSENDIAGMKAQNPKPRYRLLTNGTDLSRYIMPEHPAERKGIVFTGKLDLWANKMMITNIVENILPEVKKAVPDIFFNIVGAKPKPYVWKLVSDNVKVYPNVPDLAPYLHSARVFLHPHVGASGIQNKLLEAMACGCPVVTTKTGIQGIDAVHGEHVLIGNSTEEMIEHTIRLLTDDVLVDKISINARKLIEETHSWENVYTALDDILAEIFPELNK